MAKTNITGNEIHTQTFEILLCSPVWVGELKQQSILFSAVNILFSITAILGNSLILVALHKESSLHPPSKLFIIIREMAIVFVFFNSTLNPFIYCWKIIEVRRVVKQIIRQAICYA